MQLIISFTSKIQKQFEIRSAIFRAGEAKAIKRQNENKFGLKIALLALKFNFLFERIGAHYTYTILGILYRV